MTLYDAKCKRKYLIKKITEEEGTERRLQSLGLTENSAVELIRRNFGGAAIVKFRGTRFALGKEICKGIELWGDLN